MSWQDLGSIGELVSAIAVIVSLVYLALQIRQNTNHLEHNTKATQATAFDSSITHAMVARQAIFQNEDVARVYREGMADPMGLSEQDRMRFRLIMHNILWSIWNLQSQSQAGGIAAETWHAQLAILRRIAPSRGFIWFWSHYSQEFGETFQGVVAGVQASPASEDDPS